jgi:hypothetical protein
MLCLRYRNLAQLLGGLCNYVYMHVFSMDLRDKPMYILSLQSASPNLSDLQIRVF